MGTKKQLVPVKVYELVPIECQHQKSFNHNAYVNVFKDGMEELISYHTVIMRKYKDGSLERVWPGCTPTTLKHVKAFCGLNKAEYMGMEVS